MLQKWLLNKLSYLKLKIWNIEFIKKNNLILLIILIITLTLFFEEKISLKYKLVVF